MPTKSRCFINNRNLFLTVPEVPKFKIEAQVESVSDEDPLRGSWLVGGAGELYGVSYKDTNPIVRAPSL